MTDLRNVALFAGIGGLELGLHAYGWETELLCENDPAAQAVLRHRFPDIPLADDVRSMTSLPRADLLSAGFPCSDLSQAGATKGIKGKNSRLVSQVFRLVDRARRKPNWILLENVPFMLSLQSGRAMHYLTQALLDLGYAWAYRVVDTRAFGLPQRRRRVILLASRNDDPREVILAGDAEQDLPGKRSRSLCGFYWTEGNSGLGWAVDAVPTLKGGSTLGIPSPPAVAVPERGLGVPDIRDAERLQGFAPYWTSPAEWETGRVGARWRLIGNAVSVPVSRWIGRKLRNPRSFQNDSHLLEEGDPWPRAAWSTDGRIHAVHVGEFPVAHAYQSLRAFLRAPLWPLSLKATSGFLGRIEATTLRLPTGFSELVRTHHARMVKNGDDRSPLLQPVGKR